MHARSSRKSKINESRANSPPPSNSLHRHTLPLKFNAQGHFGIGITNYLLLFIIKQIVHFVLI